MNLMSRNLVLLVLALVLAVPTALQLSADADTFVDVGRIPLMFQGFTSDNVGAVLLALPQAEQPEPAANPNPNQPQQQRIVYDELLLQLLDGTWRIGQLPNQVPNKLAGAPIQKARLEADVFHHLRMIRNDPNTLVQSNASEEQLKKYGLDEAHAYLIRVVDKSGTNALAEVYVGDDASVGRSDTEAVRGVFVRQFGSNDVVLYEWDKPWRRSVETDGWLDKVLGRFEPDHIRRLSIRNLATGGKAFVFEREPNKSMWLAKTHAEDLGAVRQAEIEGLTQRFRYLDVERFEWTLKNAGNMQLYGLFPPDVVIEFTVAEGSTEREVLIEIGKRVEGRNEYYITCSLAPFVMTWNPSMVLPFELDVAARLFDPK